MASSQPKLRGTRFYIMQSLKKLCSEQNGGRYKVHRGPVNWSTYGLEAGKYGIAIMCDECSFLRVRQYAQITLEIMTGFNMAQVDSSEEITDEMAADAEEILKRLLQERVPPGLENAGDSLIGGYDQQNDMILEVSDTTQKLQGVIATFRVEYF